MIITDEKILRQKSHPTNIDEVKKTHALEKILAALPTAWAPGTGLAAIQVGIPIRMGYYQIPGQSPKVLLNPEILEKSEPFAYPNEGCLSIPNKRFSTERYYKIKIKFSDVLYEVRGFEAILIQHEIDHMDGILCTDRIYKPKQGRNETCACNSGLKVTHKDKCEKIQSILA